MRYVSNKDDLHHLPRKSYHRTFTLYVAGPVDLISPRRVRDCTLVRDMVSHCLPPEVCVMTIDNLTVLSIYLKRV